MNLRTKEQKIKASPDYILLAVIVILVLWGIFTVGTVSFPLSLQKQGNLWYYLLHQLLMLAIGIVLAVFSFKFPLKILKKWAPFLFILNLIAVMLVFVPQIGVKLGGARRWLSLGGFLVQPSEFLKITFVLYLAAWLSERPELLKEKRFKPANRWFRVATEVSNLLLPFCIILIVLIALLIFQPDMSTLAIICLVGVIMYFATATPWWHTFLILTLGTACGMLLIKLEPYRLNRLLVFLKPETEPLGIGYQVNQAAIAIGSGGLFGLKEGLRLGLSRQKFGFLPHSLTDSIFAIIGEELGFFGASFLIFLFLFFAWRGIKVATRAKENFEKLLALGIIAWLFWQAFLNIGGIIGILPLAGIPLPFFSYGGSHLITEMIAVGILLNISGQIY